MITHFFRVVIRESLDDDTLDAITQECLDDAAFLTEGTLSIVEFDREGTSTAQAVAEAVGDLLEAGLTPVRVLDGDIVSLQDIADRIGQSRESVRRYASAVRGQRGFPAPVNPSREGTTFYRWSEVSPWIRENLDVKVELAGTDHALVMANLVLQVRLLKDEVEQADALLALLRSS